ncbi:MAG TPA: TIGR03936 family radical SAM-associated protein [Pirellulales bacterium]|jgi:radical SAM-linked protein|nr:TIGR03936 family radical SAM-associated protein [Pirellulales bacterium]
MIRQRVRIRFTKQDDLRWISHRDLMRVWERLFRRAGVALSMTEGFHPKPRINMPSALAVGIAGSDELLEIDLAEEYTADTLKAAIGPELPPGINIGAIDVLAAPDRKAQVKFVTFEVAIPPKWQSPLVERIAWLTGHASFPIQRKGRTTPLDLRPLIASLLLHHGVLQMRLRVDGEGSARPREILQALQIENLEYEGFFLTRTRVEVE